MLLLRPLLALAIDRITLGVSRIYGRAAVLAWTRFHRCVSSVRRIFTVYNLWFMERMRDCKVYWRRTGVRVCLLQQLRLKVRDEFKVPGGMGFSSGCRLY